MSSDEDFIGPVIQVFVKEPGRGGMLENVHLRQLAGREFLVGTLAPFDVSDQRAGHETWCALDHVQMLIHFSSVEQARRYYAAHRQHKAEKQQKQRLRWWQGW